MSATMTQDIALRILTAGAILIVTFLIDFAFGKLVTRAFGKRNRSSAYEIGRVGSIVIWVGGILSALPVIGASDTVVAVVILLAGAYLILATKDLTANWFSGQMIKTVAPFKVGDWIRTSDIYGRVTRIDSMFTTLVTKTNETVLIPNAKLSSGVIVDKSAGGSLKLPIELEVENTFGFERAAAIARVIAQELAEQLSEMDDDVEKGVKNSAPEIYLVSQDIRSTRLKVVLRIDNPSKEEEISSNFRKRFSELRETHIDSTTAATQLRSS